MTYEKKAMTAFAQAALAASDLINNKFQDTIFSGKVSRKVVVEAPNVESTGGGKQARESIVLKPDGEGPSITCGFLDVGLRSCELRSFAALDVMSRQRSQILDLRSSEYEKFLADLRQLLEGEGFVIKVVEAQEQQAKAAAAGNLPEKRGGGGNTGVMIAIGAVAALVVIAVLVLLVLK